MMLLTSSFPWNKLTRLPDTPDAAGRIVVLICKEILWLEERSGFPKESQGSLLEGWVGAVRN